MDGFAVYGFMAQHLHSGSIAMCVVEGCMGGVSKPIRPFKSSGSLKTCHVLQWTKYVMLRLLSVNTVTVMWLTSR